MNIYYYTTPIILAIVSLCWYYFNHSRKKHRMIQHKPKKKSFGKIIKMWEHNGWGNNVDFFDYENRRIYGHMTPRPKVGDVLLAKMTSGKTGVFRIKNLTTKTIHQTCSSVMFQTSDRGHLYRDIFTYDAEAEKNDPHFTKQDNAWWMANTGKKYSGNLLDGVQHLNFPQTQ